MLTGWWIIYPTCALAVRRPSRSWWSGFVQFLFHLLFFSFFNNCVFLSGETDQLLIGKVMFHILFISINSLIANISSIVKRWLQFTCFPGMIYCNKSFCRCLATWLLCLKFSPHWMWVYMYFLGFIWFSKCLWNYSAPFPC